MLTIMIAGIPVGIDDRFGYIRWLVRDYLTDKAPDFIVSATPEELAKERSANDFPCSDGYLEGIVIYRKIAERLPGYDAFVFHGSVIALDGSGYAFTARSGVGKTTHTRLWLERFEGRAHYVNGDKPIIRFIGGTPYAFGTPWMGKENYGTNESVPLCGIAFLERAQNNSATEVDCDSVSSEMLTQMYIPRENPAMALCALSLCDRVLSSVRLIRLKCNMEPDAPLASARAFGITE